MSFDDRVRRVQAAAYVYYADPAFDTSMTATVTGGDYFGTKDELFDGYTYPSAAPAPQWFVLGESALNAGHVIYGANESQIGWVATTRSNSDGTITGTVQALLEFSSRSVKSVMVRGDALRNEYPVAFTIELYYSSAWHTEVTETSNSSEWFSETLSATRSGVTKARLTITEWSKGYRYPNILEFAIDNTASLSTADIQSISTKKDYMVEGLGIPWGSCAAAELTITYKRDTELAVSDYRTNAPIGLYFGYIGSPSVLSSYGVFYVSDWKIKQFTVTAIAHNIIARLSDITYSALHYGTAQSYSVIMRDIALEAGLTATLPTIADTVSWIIFKPMNGLKAMQTVLAAAGYVCYVDQYNHLAFEAIGASKTSVKTLTNTTHILDGADDAVDMSSMATKFDICYYEYTKASSKTNVIESVETIAFTASETKTMIYNFPDTIEAADEITSGDVSLSADFTLDDITVYSWGVSLEISNDLATTNNLTSVTVQGKAITAAERIYSTIDTDAQSKYGTITYTMKNKLVQSYSRAVAIATAMKALYNAPDKVSTIPTRCDPFTVVPGVKATIPDGAGTRDVIVQSQDISFDGTMSDKLTVREA